LKTVVRGKSKLFIENINFVFHFAASCAVQPLPREMIEPKADEFVGGMRKFYEEELRHVCCESEWSANEARRAGCVVHTAAVRMRMCKFSRDHVEGSTCITKNLKLEYLAQH
jgi:hypothetical protein